MTQLDMFAAPKKDGLQEGIERADYGIRKVSRHHGDWVDRARQTAVAFAKLHGRVTSDDLYEICPLPEGAHPNLMGSVWRGIDLRVIGYAPSRRPEAHGRIIRVYTNEPR